MPGVRVVTDSACDLPEALATELGIEIVPLTIRFGDEEFVDRRDLTPKEFWSRCAASPVLPETAAPPPGAFEEAFRRAAAAGADGVVCVNLAGKLSATIQSAQLAAKAVEGDIAVRVVDSKSVTLGLGMIAVAAARLGAEGRGLEEVASAAEAQVDRTFVYGALDTLDNLRKGGRIGSAQAVLGSVLSIKPIISITDGAVHPMAKQRTRSRSLAYLVDKVQEHGALESVAVLHGDAPDVDQVIDRLAQSFPRERIVVSEVGPVIGAHAGPRVIGVAFQVPAPA